MLRVMFNLNHPLKTTSKDVGQEKSGNYWAAAVDIIQQVIGAGENMSHSKHLLTSASTRPSVNSGIYWWIFYQKLVWF